MKTVLRNAYEYCNGTFVNKTYCLEKGYLSPVQDMASLNGEACVTLDNCYILPGLCDVHVHFREPGFLYKEDIETGSLAAAHGGYTAVCTMPNLNPVPDSIQHLKPQMEAIAQKAWIPVYPYGAITVGQKGECLSAMDELCEHVIAFSDDGRGVQNEERMLQAMKNAKRLGKVIVAHCEDNSLLRGGYIHDGQYAKLHGHRGICSESEWRPIERDLALAAKTGCAYHVCHISTKESVELIRKAKAMGVDVTCETAPHYLILNDMDLQEHARFKMNPPIRSEEDRLALLEGILDGTIDMIATDHAPHSLEEKSRGLEKSLMGVVGLETAFPIMYTHFVKNGVLTMERLVELMSINPRKRFGICSDVGCSVWNLQASYTVDPNTFLTRGRSTPFEGVTVCGENLLTVYNGAPVYQKRG